MKFILGFITLLGVLKELITLCFVIFQWVRDNYARREERKEVMVEVAEGIKESLQNGNTTRLQNVSDPNAQPFPRKEVP